MCLPHGFVSCKWVSYNKLTAIMKIFPMRMVYMMTAHQSKLCVRCKRRIRQPIVMYKMKGDQEVSTQGTDELCVAVNVCQMLQPIKIALKLFQCHCEAHTRILSSGLIQATLVSSPLTLSHHLCEDTINTHLTMIKKLRAHNPLEYALRLSRSGLTRAHKMPFTTRKWQLNPNRL